MLNVEDADEDIVSAGSRQSRRPSRQAAADPVLVAGGGTTPTEGGVVPMTECVTELAAQTLAQLEPDIVDAQLVEGGKIHLLDPTNLNICVSSNETFHSHRRQDYSLFVLRA